MWDPIAYYAFGFLDCDPTHIHHRRRRRRHHDQPPPPLTMHLVIPSPPHAPARASLVRRLLPLSALLALHLQPVASE